MARSAADDLAVHLRTRLMGGRALLGLARDLQEVLEPRGAWLVLNDRADVARAAGAAAVVTGRTGLSASDARRAAALPVGRSVHSAEAARRAVVEGADFLVAGAVFETASHPDVRPGGLDLVRAAAAASRPVVAIGGMVPGRAAEVMDAGAAAVAAIRALWDAADPAVAARDFLAAMGGPGTITLTVNGERRRARAGTTLAGLLGELGLDPRAVVVEHNRAVVRRERLSGVVLTDGDAVELVHFVGGG
jgi:thiamine biosynthesis protein ThiS